MYRIFYAEKDTTLYEKYPEQNTGIDQILELTKVTSASRVDGVIQANSYNSRILLDFGTEIITLSQSIADGDIPMPESDIMSSSVYLNLHASDASDLLQTYTIIAAPVSESWSNGHGTLGDSPKTKIGASWYNRTGDAIALGATAWDTGSHNAGELGNGVTNQYGGGSYILSGIDGSYGTQTFTNQSPDIRINVTDIVRGWIKGDRPNHGFLIKRPSADERSAEILGLLKFFGRESHTIFVPRLEVGWDDLGSTGGLAQITSNTYIPYIKNIKPEYRKWEIANFRIGVRPEFPTRTFQTSSFYMTDERLPVSSSYSIIDSVTNETIIPFTEINNNFSNSKTKISSDANGSYFKLRMDNFMPERYYKIMLKCERTTDVQTFDDFYFKVVN